MQWADLDPDAAPDTWDFKILEFLGCDANTPVRQLGLLAEAEYTEEINGWRVDGTRPPLAVRAKAKLLGLVSRVAVGADYSPMQLGGRT